MGSGLSAWDEGSVSGWGSVRGNSVKEWGSVKRWGFGERTEVQ